MTESEFITDMKVTLSMIDYTIDLPHRDDLVLAWDNGLAVKFVDGQPRAIHALYAESIVTPDQSRNMPEEAWGFIPRCINGHGECAKLIARHELLARERDVVENLIQKFAA